MKFKLDLKNSKIKKVAIFSCIFALTFSFFLLFTFPYGIFKETLSNNIKRSSGFDVEIGSMGMSLPLGIKLQKVNITKPGMRQSLAFDQVRLNVGVLALFTAKLGIYVDMEKANSKKELGELGLAAKISLIPLLFKQKLQLSSVTVDAEKFSISDIAGLALGSVSSRRGMNPLLQPLLEAVDFRGKLDGEMDLAMTGSKPSSASGKVNLSLVQASLTMQDDSIPRQVFKKALIKANIKKGTISFDKNAGLESADLNVGVTGQMGLKENVNMSMLNLKLDLKLDGELKESWGDILDGLAGGDGSGRITKSITGTFAQPNII